MKRRLYLYLSAALAVSCWQPAAVVAADGAPAEPDIGPTEYGTDRLDAKGVGIAGGIIVGAEAVMAVQAAVGVDKMWPYFVFPVLGAGAGGVGGYYLEKVSAPGAVALLVSGIALIIPTAILTASAFSYNPEDEGALKGDTMDTKQFSFELPPDEQSVSEVEEDKAVTDVEMQPETGPPAEAAPPETTEPAPTEVPDAPPADDAVTPAPSGAGHQTSKPTLAAERHPSGTLLHVDRQGAFSMSVPFLDVRPITMISDELRADGALRRNNGVEFHIPLLRVDLP